MKVVEGPAGSGHRSYLSSGGDPSPSEGHGSEQWLEDLLANDDTEVDMSQEVSANSAQCGCGACKKELCREFVWNLNGSEG
ncbi:hypothetical protein MKW98_015407 [Papaver atlanticum]|uniref:Uncharacterized protein n=1 Tax=Papaver atlanticum TaxID=357466 RepID=A0AAD4RYN5_9MAGN|nr:hypothetical protein MKW98_015407 [Papaver atlanticum]